MKKNRLLALLLVLAICLPLCTGCGQYIGKAKAKEIAFADAGVTAKEVRDLECDLDREVIGATVYEVNFDVGFTEYEYDIDAVTGEILGFKID